MRKPVLANRLFVPIELVSEEAVDDLYRQYTFVETVCRRCPIFKDGLRPASKCFQCTGDLPGTWNGFTGELVQWRRVQIKGQPYYSLPVGDIDEATQELNLDLSNAVDYRCRKKMDVPINFTGKLYTGRELVNGKRMANQIGIVKTFWRTPHRSGIIQAPPRTGKTVLGAFFSCAFKYKTLILAHESILLDQFYKEIRRFTDIAEQEKMVGRPLMVKVETERHLKMDVEIMLINYQKLISDLGIARVLKYLQKRFGLLLVDEIHRAGTDHYMELLDRLNPAHRIGFSATPARRDGRQAVFLRSLGPIRVVARVDTLKPTIYIHSTDADSNKRFGGRAGFTNACTFLSEHQGRNISIVKQAFADLRENPKNIIVIPVHKLVHGRTLVEMINRQGRFNNTNRDEAWPDIIAELLWRDADKKQIIADVSARRVRVLVAIQKFVKEGTNIPALSHYYQIFPQNNRVSTEQGTARILTPLDGKPDPIIRYWSDPLGICISCFKNTYTDSFIPLGYKVAEESKVEVARLMRLERDPKTRKYHDPQERDKMLTMW